jgi:hypothetical protein
MRKIAALLAAGLVLAACASNPIPDGYTGPVANIQDSFASHGDTSADFFFVAKVDGRTVDNALSSTIQSNAGMGALMRPQGFDRNVPAQPSTVTITARTHYGAPILELANKVYQVSGDVRFAPLPDHHYIVKGQLGDNYSAVWIEDLATNGIVGNKVEIKGSAALDFLSK